MTVLEKYRRKPHPTKQVLVNQFKVPIATIASFLGVNYTYTSSILSGVIHTKKHDKRLWQLVNELEKEKAAGTSA